MHIFDSIGRTPETPYTNPYKPFHLWDWKNLMFLGIDHAWFDLDRDSKGQLTVYQWPPRQVYNFSTLADQRIDEDGEWLMRYHRGVLGLE